MLDWLDPFITELQLYLEHFLDTFTYVQEAWQYTKGEIFFAYEEIQIIADALPSIIGGAITSFFVIALCLRIVGK